MNSFNSKIEPGKNSSIDTFNVLSLILFVSIPMLYFLLDYKPLPVIVIAGSFFLIFASIQILELTGRIELIFAFLILFISFYGFSSFPGSNFTEVNNYAILAFLYLLLLITFIFSRPQEYLSPNLSNTDKNILFVFTFFFFM